MTAFWVGLRIFLMPTLLFLGILWFQDQASASGPVDHPAAAMGGGMMESSLATLKGLGDLGALGLGGVGAGCNTLGFGCGGSITTGAKWVRP